MELTVLSAAHAQLVPLLESGQAGAESSFIKIAGTTLLHRLSDLLFEAASVLDGGHEPITPGEVTLHPATDFLQSRRATIYGGTQEIQKTSSRSACSDFHDGHKFETEDCSGCIGSHASKRIELRASELASNN